MSRETETALWIVGGALLGWHVPGIGILFLLAVLAWLAWHVARAAWWVLSWAFRTMFPRVTADAVRRVLLRAWRAVFPYVGPGDFFAFLGSFVVLYGMVSFVAWLCGFPLDGIIFAWSLAGPVLMVLLVVRAAFGRGPRLRWSDERKPGAAPGASGTRPGRPW